MKVLKPLYKNETDEDIAYSCRCYCNVEAQNYSTGKQGAWWPGDCGCTCAAGNVTNHNKNSEVVG